VDRCFISRREENAVHLRQIVPPQVIGSVGAEAIAEDRDGPLAPIVYVGESSSGGLVPPRDAKIQTFRFQLGFRAVADVVITERSEEGGIAG
jgi:hypothetical protein